MNPNETTALKRVWKHLQSVGVLVVSDSKLPSLARMVAEAPLRGSWWAHAQAHAIFRAGRALETRHDVLTTRLISGKVTFVHQKLWPALFAVAAAREPWQLEGLSARARWLLERVTSQRPLRTDELAAGGAGTAKVLGEAARGLEKRLLVYGESLHTESGAHTKKLESWEHLANRLSFNIPKLEPKAAKQQFEVIAAELESRFHARVRLPWPSRRR